jgi:hypothetical protein
MPAEALEEGQVAMTPAVIMRLRESAIIARTKEVKKLRDLKPQLYAKLWKQLSEDSAVNISAHEDFDETHRNSDPFALWKIIVYTHLTHVNGAGAELVELIRDNELDKFRAIVQSTKETIGEFLVKFKRAHVVLVAAGIPEFTEPQKAIQLLKKLDKNRHGAMFAELCNSAQRGEKLPQTLFEAFTIASHYLVKRAPGAFSSEEHSIYMADRVPNNRGRGNGRINGRARGRGRGRTTPYVETRACHNCDRIGHLSRNCPDPPRGDRPNDVLAVTTTEIETEMFDDMNSVTSGAYAYVVISSNASRADSMGLSHCEHVGLTNQDAAIISRDESGDQVVGPRTVVDDTTVHGHRTVVDDTTVQSSRTAVDDIAVHGHRTVVDDTTVQSSRSVVDDPVNGMRVTVRFDNHPTLPIFINQRSYSSTRNGVNAYQPVSIERKTLLVFIDCGASISVFCNHSLLHNIHEVTDWITIQGNSGEIKLTQKGTFGDFGSDWFSELMSVNLLSQSALVDSGCIVRYNSEQDYFTVKRLLTSNEQNIRNVYHRLKNTFIFRRSNGSMLYAMRFNDFQPWSQFARRPIPPEEKAFQYFRHRAYFSTVEKKPRNVYCDGMQKSCRSQNVHVHSFCWMFC